MTSSPRGPEFLAECRALVQALSRYPGIEALRADPDGQALERRLHKLLDQVWWHAPGDGASPAVPATGGALHAVHWNIEHGNWYEQIEDALRNHEALRGADLVLMNEVDLGCARSGNRDVTGELSSALGLYGAYAPMFLERTVGRDDDPACAGDRRNQEGLVGVAVLSRWPIRATRLVHLPGPDRVHFDLERMFGRYVALVAEIDRPGAPFVAVSVHLEVHRTRAHRALQMRMLLEALAAEHRPIVLAGDFNAHTFDRGLWHSSVTGALALLVQPGRSLERRLRRPDRGPMREPLFDELRKNGFDWEPFTDDLPTLQVRMERLDEAGRMLRFAGPFEPRVRRWAESRSRLRLDWFAGRGWRGGSGRTVTGLDGPGRASDHAPITARFE